MPRRGSTSYRIRILASVASILLLANVLVRLPWFRSQGLVGWRILERENSLVLLPRQQDSPRPDGGGAPVTRFGKIAVPSDSLATARALVTRAEAGDPETREEPMRVVEPMQRVVLALAEHMPTIRGGLGAYYLNIQYPPEAIQRSIEGRLVLEFVVEVDGSTSDVGVLSPLHPLCDSAAVRALRRTRFAPGIHQGEPVAVRMRLPVRFELVNRLPDAPADSTG